MTDPSVPNPGRAPRKTNNGLMWVILGCSAAVLFFVSAFVFLNFIRPGMDLGSGSSGGSAASDVGTPNCSHPSGTRDYLATVTVTNSTDRPRDYTVTVAFLRGDKTEITTGTGHVNRLQPGKSFKVEVNGRAAPEFLGTCEVDSVRRS